jgi:hypothetical protein
MDGWPALPAEKVQQAAGLPGGSDRIFQFASAAREIVVLDVDQDQDGFHDPIVTKMPGPLRSDRVSQMA